MLAAVNAQRKRKLGDVPLTDVFAAVSAGTPPSVSLHAHATQSNTVLHRPHLPQITDCGLSITQGALLQGPCEQGKKLKVSEVPVMLSHRYVLLLPSGEASVMVRLRPSADDPGCMAVTRLPALRPGQPPPGPLLGGRQPGHHPAPAHPLRLRGQRARTRAPAPAAGGGASASSGPSQLGTRLKPSSCRPGPDTTV
jgi:hypothetical protein